MKTDKARIQFDGKTLLDRALGVAESVCERVFILGDPAKFADYTSRSVIADVFPDCGPLAGIYSALLNSSSEHGLSLMLAVDMPFVTSDLIAWLFARAERDSAVVTVPIAENKQQPLCSIYRKGFATVAERALRAGNYKIGSVLSEVSTQIIAEAELKAAGFSSRNFFNVNTPQDRAAIDGNSI
jgi:molybdopterin-guanine dinucleotide biosynthesis protein A